MAGFWHLSHHQMRSPNGDIYAAARAYFFAADSLALLTVYQDYSLGTPHSNPVEANASGIFPPVFFSEDDNFYRQRITTSGGVVIPGTDVGILPIIGPSGGGGGVEVPVDPNALWQTGDLKARYGTGTHTGWVRANGRTLGSGTSGATERANADTEQLFLYLYGADANLTVSGGRGASAAADWSANKTITLPDWRGCALAFLDDMGNSVASRLTTATFTTLAPTVLGAIAGEQRHILAQAELPAFKPPITITDPHHTHLTGPGTHNAGGALARAQDGAGFVDFLRAPGALSALTTGSSATGITAALTNNLGSDTPHNNVQPTRLATLYIKL